MLTLNLKMFIDREYQIFFKAIKHKDIKLYYKKSKSN